MQVYLDHAATTPVLPQVVDAMSDFMREHFGNPSSLHAFGADSKKYLERAREQVAALIGAPAEQLYFTSGGTEADNIAIFGCAMYQARQGRRHIITSAVEHHAVLESCEELAKQGFELTVLPVDEYGMVSVQSLREALREDTALVTVMHANNEVGTINPIRELAALAHQAGAVMHTDSVQSAGKIPCDVGELGVDMMSISSHKINGPKGVGALYKKPDIPLYRRVYGGGQEHKLRSGTENMPGIVGFGVAAEYAAAAWRRETAAWRELRDMLVSGVLNGIPYSRLNGHPSERLPHNANFSFDYIEGEALLLHLDLSGIACSSGSACSSGEMEPSHVLKAMGLGNNWLHSALRFSLGYGNNAEQIAYTIQVLKDKVELLRAASPFYNK
ncbi:MAG: cysteine desulfurase family protein [Bacillota bacterium]|nr:cysteine desulfurase family protein [Bacillota bacterium]